MMYVLEFVYMPLLVMVPDIKILLFSYITWYQIVAVFVLPLEMYR